MAQYQKEEIKSAILKSAQDEFIKNGFRGASIRTIADNASVKPSNIYNYYKNKEKLFHNVLLPLLTEIESGICNLENCFQSLPDIYQDVEHHHKLILTMADFIEKNRLLIGLLVFGSTGSPHEKFCDNIIKRYSELWLAFCSNKKNNNIDFFVLHNISGIWYNFIREILMHNIQGPQLRKAACDIMSFLYGGFCFLKNQARSNNCIICKNKFNENTCTDQNSQFE